MYTSRAHQRDDAVQVNVLAKSTYIYSDAPPPFQMLGMFSARGMHLEQIK